MIRSQSYATRPWTVTTFAAIPVERRHGRVDDIQPLAAERGVGARDAVERAQAEGVPERAGREDEERRPLDQDDLGVGDQAPNGQTGG